MAKNEYEENIDCGQGEGFLGLNCDANKDKIKLDLRYVRDSLEHRITKRRVLPIISKIFYPCGFISPDAIGVKILMQKLWGKGLKWDEELQKDREKVESLVF